MKTFTNSQRRVISQHAVTLVAQTRASDSRASRSPAAAAICSGW